MKASRITTLMLVYFTCGLFLMSCGSGSSNGVANKSNSTNTNSDNNSNSIPLPNANTDLNNNSNTSVGDSYPNGVINFASTNDEAKSNCSSPSAKYTSYLLNVDFDIRVCVEFVLDVPSTSSRFGESKICVNDSDFVTLGNNNEWVYNQTERSWRIKNGGSVNTRSSYFAPGTYRSVAKDKLNNIYRSNFVYVGRNGFENCNP